MKKIEKIYKGKIGASFGKEKAQKIGEFIYEKCQGMSTKEILEKIKESPEEEIYDLIEWDDEKASEAYRLHQIIVIINHIEVEIKVIGDNKPRKCFYNIKTEGKKEKTWETIETVMNDAEMRQQVINKALRTLEYWENTYRNYKELNEISERIRKYLKKMKK